MIMRVRMSRVLVCATALALSASLAACGNGSGGGSADDGKIHVLVYGDASNKVEKQIVDTFNKT